MYENTSKLECAFNSTSEVREWPLMGLRVWVHLLSPHETNFETLSEASQFFNKNGISFFVIMLCEYLILRATGRKNEWRINESIVSCSGYVLTDAFGKCFCRGLEFLLYQWVYENYRLITMPWNSFYSYLIPLLTVDFCGYWWHRMAHEVAILWTSHEFHHNSDDYNTSVALRISAPMGLFKWIFYIPLAFIGIPLPVMFTHKSLGIFYNGFVHQHAFPKLDKVVPIVGDVIEFIFVTPSHHRVHHAINKYCIDKNYGMYLIIWDRMFNTFESERDDIPLTYGSLTQAQSYDTVKLQFFSHEKLWSKFRRMDNLADKLRVLFYSPNWLPGKSRYEIFDDIPDVPERKKYSPDYSFWISFYLILNSMCIIYAYFTMALGRKVPSTNEIFIFAFVLTNFAAFGGLYDRRKYSPFLELVRILLVIGLLTLYSTQFPGITSKIILYMHCLDLLFVPYLYHYVENFHRYPVKNRN